MVGHNEAQHPNKRNTFIGPKLLLFVYKVKYFLKYEKAKIIIISD